MRYNLRNKLKRILGILKTVEFDHNFRLAERKNKITRSKQYSYLNDNTKASKTTDNLNHLHNK